MTEESKVAAAPVEKSAAKKRPWRDKVRKAAAKKAAKKAREEAVLNGTPVMGEPQAKKTKKAEKPEKKKDSKNTIKKEKTKKSEELKDKAQKTIKKIKGQEDEGTEKVSATDEFRKKLESGRFRFLNEKLYTMSGSEALQFFAEDPEAFDCYHKGFTEQVKKWPNHPLKVIVKWLKKLDGGKMVYDLGCGEAKIAEKIGEYHKVHSFDLVAVNDRVTSCDMANLPVEKDSADVVIFCLSLMGTNIPDFIKEARRILKVGGTLKIAEVTSRFVKINLFVEAVCQLGFELTSKQKSTDYFMLMQFKKIEKVTSKRPYGLKLKPCIYKRR